MPLAESERKLTYADYLRWPDEDRWEVIEGEAFAMTPAPSFRHQRVAFRFAYALETALRGRPCVPCLAPIDVVLAEDTVVQPDVVVICDPSKIRPDRVAGAPDLVVEVVSPTTGFKDRKVKRDLYERHGVREYVLLDPDAQCAERYALCQDGAYGKAEVFGPAEVLILGSLGGVEISLAEVFESAAPPPQRP